MDEKARKHNKGGRMRIKLVNKKTNKSVVYNYNDTNTFYDLKQFIIASFETFKQVNLNNIQFETGRPASEIIADDNAAVRSLLSSGSMCMVSKIKQLTNEPIEWHCSMCTLINIANSNICAACGSTKNDKNNNDNNTATTSSSNNNGNNTSKSRGHLNDNYVNNNDNKNSDKQLNAVRRIIPSDNSCLFNAIAYILEGRRGRKREKTTTASIATRLRDRVALTVTNGNQWTPAVLGMEKKSYVKYIKDVNKWGGGIECNIFADIYHVEVCAIDIFTKQRYCFGESSGFKRRAFLLYTGTHYDALTFTKKGKNSKDEDSDVCMLDLPIPQYINDDIEKLVDQLRALKQFTNLGNFNTQCCVCYKKFQGQKGVIDHAQNSGHQNFSEIPN